MWSISWMGRLPIPIRICSHKSSTKMQVEKKESSLPLQQKEPLPDRKEGALLRCGKGGSLLLPTKTKAKSSPTTRWSKSPKKVCCRASNQQKVTIRRFCGHQKMTPQRGSTFCFTLSGQVMPPMWRHSKKPVAYGTLPTSNAVMTPSAV